MSDIGLAQRIVALDRALRRVPHAFGGAIALAYYAEPRSTIDIDLNVFITADELERVAVPLRRLGVEFDDTAIALIQRDGQARVRWDDTPIDLFFAYDPFHDAAAADRRRVPFADGTIPILSLEHLVVCKAVFNRPRDWVDIDAILALDPAVDSAEALRWVARIAGDDDPRFARLAAVLTRR